MSEQNTCVKPHEWYKEYYSGFLNEDDIAEFIEVDTNLSNYPNNVPKEEFFIGCWLIQSEIEHNYLINNNNIEDNTNALNQCVEIITHLTPSLSEELRLVFYEQRQKIPLLSKILKAGYCISPQLLYLFDLINDELEKIFSGEEYLKVKLPHPDIEFLTSHLSNPSTISFDSFTLDLDQVIDLIKKNERWQKPDRDLTIYFERKKGRTLQDIADDYDIVFTAVSRVEKKVRGAVSYWKGKLFESFINNQLKQSHRFSSISLEGDVGEPDILAYSRDKKSLYIYSLKNLKIDRKPYWLTKEELRPELERAKLCSLDYEIHLILLVFDSFHDKIKQFKIDYDNPKNIDLSK